MVYDDVHRFLLRSVASHGMLSLSQTKTILQNFTGKEQIDIVYIKKTVDEINSEIILFQQAIKMLRDEESEINDEYLVFLSNGNDDITKSQNIFSDKELEYFRIILENILISNNGQIGAIDALNFNNSKSLSKKEAEVLLQRWCQMHYLKEMRTTVTERHREQVFVHYTLGLRGINEFDSYKLGAIVKCCLCKENMFRVYHKCPSCRKAVGKWCLGKYLERIKEWPCCKHQFLQSDLHETVQLDNSDMESEELESDNAVDSSTSDEVEAPPIKRRRIIEEEENKNMEEIYVVDSDSS